ncbi:hypothetical protein Agub_g2713 [Astrephomene gubernaculifera]|uniref:Uncharacterized protein n=1 Tax=Astrephomene gubernaculifera TaxID=47775 RepID=A0AAD3DHG9_9CHLO|nr:hypothetical protein Agub_g2713 [Astrephomene gubernaculifera]
MESQAPPPLQGSLSSSKVLPVTTASGTDPEGGQPETPALELGGINLKDALAGRTAAARTKLEKILNEFDKDKDGQLSAAELGQVIERLAAERSNKKVLMGVIIGFVVFSIMLIGALSGMTWGVVAALKEEEIRGGKMYDIEDPTQVVQTANSDMSVVGGVLVNRQAFEATTSPDNSTALPGTGNTPHASTVLRTAAFVGTPQKFSSQIPVKSLMELKYLYIQGAGQVEVAMTVLGVARVPQAGSAYGTVVHILTLAGTITLDGTAIDFNESLAPVFLQAGFAVASNRRSLLGAYDVLGFFNFIEDVDIFNMPSGAPRPALPSGNFRMQIQVFDPCSVPLNPSVDRCVYLPTSDTTPPAPPPANYYGNTPPPLAGDPDSSLRRSSSRRLAETGTRRRLQVTTDTTTGDGVDLAGTTIINGTRYMVHTETSTLYKGLTRTVYEYAVFPDYIKIELVNNVTNIMQSWTQEVVTNGTTPPVYFCNSKPHSALGSLGNANETLVNFTFVGYEEHFGRSARHFKLVVRQPDVSKNVSSGSSSAPPLSSLLTIDYWDSRSGAVPLGFEFSHPWIGRTMINVTEFVQLSDSDIDPADFVYPLSVAGATCGKDTSVPKLSSPFSLPSMYRVKNTTMDELVASKLASQGNKYASLFANKTAGARRRMTSAFSSSASSSSSSTSSAALRSSSNLTTSHHHLHRQRQLDSGFSALNALDSSLWCGAPAGAYITAYGVEPCTVDWANVGSFYQYLYLRGACGMQFEPWPVFLDGSITVDNCPTNSFIQGCIVLSVGLQGYIEEYLNVGWLATLSNMIDLGNDLEIELCAGWRPTDRLAYASGELDFTLSNFRVALESELDFTTSRIWLDGITLAGEVGVNMYFWSYYVQVASYTFMQDYTLWESAGSAASALAVQPNPTMYKGYNQYYLGCYGDYWNRRMNSVVTDKNMNLAWCRQAAIAAGYRYFGIEVAQECYGTNDMATATAFGPATTCNMKCGDGNLCGGPWGLSIYDSGYMGCYTDSANRTVSTLLRRDTGSVTYEVCRQLALQGGYSYFGLQASCECWATNNVLQAQSLGPAGNCNQQCSAGGGDMCGGGWANSLFSAIPNNGSAGYYGHTNASSWVGCYKDSVSTSLLTLVDSAAVMTVSRCRKAAVTWGLRYFAIQNATACLASNNLTVATSLGNSTTGCNLNCTSEGNNIYSYTNACGSATTATSTVAYNSIQDSGYLGCFKDSNVTDLVPKLLMADTNGMTPDNCRNVAAASGYDLFALQNGILCYVGAYKNLSAAISLGPAYNCNVTCPGSSDYMCGGLYANSLYQVVLAPIPVGAGSTNGTAAGRR